MSTIIVTGGYGFIGSHLVEKLISLKHAVIVLDNLSTGRRENLEHLEGQFKYIPIDLSVEGNHYMWDRFKKVDYIYHLAALPRIQLSLDEPVKTHAANVISTIRVLEFAKKYNVNRVFFSSSSSVYGDQPILPLTETMKANPRNPYALQKWMSEQYCFFYSQLFNVPTVSFRFFNVYGPRMALTGAYKLVFANWIESIKKGETMKIFGDGLQTRDFTYVDDVIDALIMGMKIKNNVGLNLNVGAGNQTSVLRLAELFGYPYEHVQARPFEEKFKEASLEKIKQYGWKPKVTIEEGIKRIKKSYDI